MENGTIRSTGDADFDEMLDMCVGIIGVKGEDYTIGTGDRLHNFKTAAEFTGMTPAAVLGVYLYKHISAIFAFIKSGGQRESEPISGRIADVINYMLLLHKMNREGERSKSPFFDDGDADEPSCFDSGAADDDADIPF